MWCGRFRRKSPPNIILNSPPAATRKMTERLNSINGVVAVLPEGGVVLDLGAGRGAKFDENVDAWKAWLIRLGKKYSRRIGVDVDPAVKTNPELDQAEVIVPGQPLPFADQTFDLVLCDWVVEHIEDPEFFVAEVRRVLKIGGWFCACTPNRWSYIAIGARMVSGWMETKLLRILAAESERGRCLPEVLQVEYAARHSGAVSRTVNGSMRPIRAIQGRPIMAITPCSTISSNYSKKSHRPRLRP